MSDSLNSPPAYDFSGVPAPALDAIRMRLSQLTHSLSKIRDDMSKAELPQWYSLQAQLAVTLSQLSSLTATLQHFEDALDSTVPYPLPNFPTTAHEGMLTTLMRKKQIPEVEAWIKDAIDSSGIELSSESQEDVERRIRHDRDETNWALKFVNHERDNYSFQGLYTAEELTSMSGDPTRALYRSSNSKAMPKTPFSVESILTYIYQGPKAREASRTPS
ncbi:HDR070Wp [Eremothecium sinecaudum]|uniref:Mediator of RNA polymerase II transcription subunit 8 n=1 Tax=Eremothecium sinecaudum TaxID=45286 RepID=A0A0X8HSQ4_9SACH|nr:HDR070Wp [Eremothecium sinecaudum]AMD20812.1 HDR070Wp [Eremothecium sinecaudum]